MPDGRQWTSVSGSAPDSSARASWRQRSRGSSEVDMPSSIREKSEPGHSSAPAAPPRSRLGREAPENPAGWPRRGAHAAHRRPWSFDGGGSTVRIGQWSLGGLLVMLIAGTAAAEELPSGLVQREAATTGRQDVATSGFEAVQPAPPPDTNDVTTFKVAFGGLFSGGNSETLALTGSTRFELRRNDNQLVAMAAGNYGEAAPAGSDERETNVENLQGKVRYDRFLSERLTAFAAVSALSDRFQGLALRANFDPGLAYYVVRDDRLEFWAELGYDLQHDVRRRDTIAKAAEGGNDVARTETRHSGRGFLGYRVRLNPKVSLDLGTEFLLSMQDTKNFRWVWDAALTSSLTEGL